MAQNNNIINHWSFLAFARQFGTDLAQGECVNHETGETFKACTFSKGGKRTFVNIGPSVEGMNIHSMVRERDGLQVIQMNVDPETIAKRQSAGKQVETYVLCRVGETSWQTVSLEGLM